MARLYKHKQWGWQVFYTLYFPDGSSVKKYRYWGNKLKAMNFMQDIEALEHRSLKNTLTKEDLLYYARIRLLSRDEADKIAGAPIDIPTLGELATEYLAISAVECREKVHRTNRSRVKSVLAYFGADCKATDVSRDDIFSYRRERLTSIKAATVNREMTKLAQILDIALVKRAIPENPARGLDKLRDRRDRIPRSLTDDEIKTLLSGAKTAQRMLYGRAYDMIAMYLYTGMRRSELLWLEWDDVDLEHRQIVVQGKESWNTKTGKFRVVGISDAIASVLRRSPRQGRFVFDSGANAPLINEDSMTRTFERIRTRSGLSPQITLHSLRHTYITHLLRAGVDIRRVKELAGHSDT